MSSYTIIIKYKQFETAVLNAAFGPDDSFQITDLITKNIVDPEFEIITFDVPVGKVGRGISIKPNEQKFYANNCLSINHHASGKLHIKGVRQQTIIQGFDVETGLPKGVGLTDGFNLVQSINDGYQFMGGIFWGLNHLSSYNSKTSIKIIFNEDDINYQTMRDSGGKLSFTVLFFHIPINKLKKEEIESGFAFYHLKNYIRPLLIKILKGNTNNYVVGVSCLKSRCVFDSDFGFTMSAGATQIDKETGTCKNLAIIYPSTRGDKTESYKSLNYLI